MTMRFLLDFFSKMWYNGNFGRLPASAARALAFMGIQHFTSLKHSPGQKFAKLTLTRTRPDACVSGAIKKDAKLRPFNRQLLL